MYTTRSSMSNNANEEREAKVKKKVKELRVIQNVEL